MGCELLCRSTDAVVIKWEHNKMVNMVGIGGGEFLVGRLAGYRRAFTESTLTSLDLRILKYEIPPNPEHTMKSTAVR